MIKRMKLTLADTVFKDAPIVSIAAKPGGCEDSQTSLPIGMLFLHKFLLGGVQF